MELQLELDYNLNEQKIEISGEKSEKVKVKNVNNIFKLSLPFSLNSLKFLLQMEKYL